MRKKPRILEVTSLAKTRYFHIQGLHLEFENGVQADYERLMGSANGAVLIVPMLDEHTVLLIREYAAGMDRYELALPKGGIEDNEDMLSAANREIMEEIGYAAHTLQHLHTITVAPGYLAHQTHLVLATNLYPRRIDGDEPEEIEVVPWSLNKLDELLAQDDFTEARSIAALFLARRALRQDIKNGPL